MKKQWMKLMTVCVLALALVFGVVACNRGGNDKPSAEGFVSVSINPSVEMTVENGKVTAVKAANDDARLLLEGEVIIGLDIKDAVAKITELAERMGYLNDTNKKVRILVAADSAKTQSDLAEQAIQGATEGSDKAEVEDSKASLVREVKRLKEANPTLYADMTPAKLALIQSVMYYDKTMTVEIGAGMSVKELGKLAKAYYEKYEDLVSDALEDKYNALEDQMEREIERKIAEIYGTEYLAMADKLFALEDLLDRFENELENVELSEEDIATIATLLELTDTSVLADANGKITAESVENYLDRLEDEFELKYGDDDEWEDLFDEVEEILERYEDDNAALTQEMIDELLAVDASISVTTIEELDDYVDDLEDELEDLQDRVNLTDEQKAAIRDLERQEDELEQKIKQEMRDEILAERAKLQEKKQEILG